MQEGLEDDEVEDEAARQARERDGAAQEETRSKAQEAHCGQTEDRGDVRPPLTLPVIVPDCVIITSEIDYPKPRAPEMRKPLLTRGIPIYEA